MNVRQLLARSPATHALGYRAVRLRASLSRSVPGHPVLVNSIPKAGTHVMTGLLDLLPDMRSSGWHLYPEMLAMDDPAGPIAAWPAVDFAKVDNVLKRPRAGQYMTAHFWPYPEFIDLVSRHDYRVLAVIRDPRDVVVSSAMYIKRLRKHHHHSYLTQVHETDSDRLLAVIRGFPAEGSRPGAWSIGSQLRGFLPWLKAPDTLVCRFEDLVGEGDGAWSEDQQGLIQQIGEHVGRPLTPTVSTDIATRVWSAKSATFRKGAVGDWQQQFAAAHYEAFEQEVDASLLSAYGYKS